MGEPLRRITTVRAGEQPLTLVLRWSDQAETEVDVSALVTRFRVFAPLRDDPALFARARVGEHGTDVVWTDDVDMSAESLWRLAQDQVRRGESAGAWPAAATG